MELPEKQYTEEEIRAIAKGEAIGEPTQEDPFMLEAAKKMEQILSGKSQKEMQSLLSDPEVASLAREISMSLSHLGPNFQTIPNKRVLGDVAKEMHPEFPAWERVKIKNSGATAQDAISYLENVTTKIGDHEEKPYKDFIFTHDRDNIYMKKLGEDKWYPLDPEKTELLDIADVGGDIAQGLATTGGAVGSAALAAPGGPLAMWAAGSAGAGAAGAAAEALKQKLTGVAPMSGERILEEGVGSALGQAVPIGPAVKGVGALAGVTGKGLSKLGAKSVDPTTISKYKNFLKSGLAKKYPNPASQESSVGIAKEFAEKVKGLVGLQKKEIGAAYDQVEKNVAEQAVPIKKQDILKLAKKAKQLEQRVPGTEESALNDIREAGNFLASKPKFNDIKNVLSVPKGQNAVKYIEQGGKGAEKKVAINRGLKEANLINRFKEKLNTMAPGRKEIDVKNTIFNDRRAKFESIFSKKRMDTEESAAINILAGKSGKARQANEAIRNVVKDAPIKDAQKATFLEHMGEFEDAAYLGSKFASEKAVPLSTKIPAHIARTAERASEKKVPEIIKAIMGQVGAGAAQSQKGVLTEDEGFVKKYLERQQKARKIQGK